MQGGMYGVQQGTLAMAVSVEKGPDSFDALYFIGDTQTGQTVYLIDGRCDGTIDEAQRCDISDDPSVCGRFKDLSLTQGLHEDMQDTLQRAMDGKEYSLAPLVPLYEQALVSPVASLSKTAPERKNKTVEYGQYQLMRMYGDFDEDGKEEMQYGVKRSSKVVMLTDTPPYGSVDKVAVCDYTSSEDFSCNLSRADGNELYAHVQSVFAQKEKEFSEEFNRLFFSVLNEEIIPDGAPPIRLMEL
jgi:hypothetical protein